MKKELIAKRKDHAFGKDIFLLGKDREGALLWLEEPKWDCDWYWGFGYIEVYTTNDPARSRDVQSHSHFSGLVGHQCNGEYIHNIYDSPELIETTFTAKEGWQLSELFKEFYLLQSMAEYSHRSPAGCHLTTSPVTQNEDIMKDWHGYINRVMIPMVTAEILRMLRP